MVVKMKLIFVTLVGVCCFEKCVSAPTRFAKNVVLIPPRFQMPQYSNLPYIQLRGPFDFIGNWIQSSEWFPIEVNVPDTVSGIGSGIGTFATNFGNGFNALAQNVGNGFQTFTQNVGNNVQSFAQNLSQRFPVLAVIVRPNTPAKYFVLMPTQSTNSASGSNKKDYYIPKQMESDMLESFP